MGSKRAKRNGRYDPAERRGAALVEFALLLPLLLALLFGFIEFGRALMVQSILTNAAREGARTSTLLGATDSQVGQVIDNYMTGNQISGHSHSLAPSLSGAPSKAAIKVTVTVPYNNVTWIPINSLSWLKGRILRAEATMRRED